MNGVFSRERERERHERASSFSVGWSTVKRVCLLTITFGNRDVGTHSQWSNVTRPFYISEFVLEKTSGKNIKTQMESWKKERNSTRERKKNVCVCTGGDRKSERSRHREICESVRKRDFERKIVSMKKNWSTRRDRKKDIKYNIQTRKVQVKKQNAFKYRMVVSFVAK